MDDQDGQNDYQFDKLGHIAQTCKNMELSRDNKQWSDTVMLIVSAVFVPTVIPATDYITFTVPPALDKTTKGRKWEKWMLD